MSMPSVVILSHVIGFNHADLAGVERNRFRLQQCSTRTRCKAPSRPDRETYCAGKAATVRNNLGEKAADRTAEVCQGKTIPVSSCLIPPPESGSQPEPCWQTIGDFPDGYITPLCADMREDAGTALPRRSADSIRRIGPPAGCDDQS